MMTRCTHVDTLTHAGVLFWLNIKDAVKVFTRDEATGVRDNNNNDLDVDSATDKRRVDTCDNTH
jgi:hypothetical protein